MCVRVYVWCLARLFVCFFYRHSRQKWNKQKQRIYLQFTHLKKFTQTTHTHTHTNRHYVPWRMNCKRVLYTKKKKITHTNIPPPHDHIILSSSYTIVSSIVSCYVCVVYHRINFVCIHSIICWCRLASQFTFNSENFTKVFELCVSIDRSVKRSCHH